MILVMLSGSTSQMSLPIPSSTAISCQRTALVPGQGDQRTKELQDSEGNTGTLHAGELQNMTVSPGCRPTQARKLKMSSHQKYTLVRTRASIRSRTAKLERPRNAAKTGARVRLLVGMGMSQNSLATRFVVSTSRTMQEAATHVEGADWRTSPAQRQALSVPLHPDRWISLSKQGIWIAPS